MPTAAAETVKVKLHRAQAEFRRGDALYRGFVGGRGAGKSFIGAYDMLRRAKPGRMYGVYAPSYPMMRDSSLRSLTDMARQLSYLREWRRSDNVLILGNGAEVVCRSLDDPERARGPNLSGAWIDEASLVPREAFDIIIASLRGGGEQGWLSATFTPRGKNHWTYETFGQGRDNTALYRAHTRDNPFLPSAFADTIAGQYTSQLAAQELAGEFIDIEGALAHREWFKIVDAHPGANMRWVRAWDFAATERSQASADPDYIVGALMGRHKADYYLRHVIRQRIGPGAVESLVLQTAEMDGRGVRIILEQEPGSAGKLYTASLIRQLAGWSVTAVPAVGDKVTRAMPYLAQAQAGNVYMVRGAWNGEYLDEMAAFPVGAHDDQADASSAAFVELALQPNSRGYLA